MPGSAAIGGLYFAVRVSAVAKYLGQALLMLAVLACVPATVAAFSGYPGVALRYLVVVLVFAVCGAFSTRLPEVSDLQRNEALVITALVFTLSAAALAYPVAGYGMSFTDALFESVSGVTTTGLTTLGSIQDRPAGFLFARAWMQWIGGLGVLALVLALVVDPGVAAKRLGFDERVDIAGGTRAHVRRVSLVYLALTVIGILALLAAGASPFDALVHAMTSVSTGGFANYDASLAALASWPVRAVITLLSLAGAISFALYYLGTFRHPLRLVRDPQFLGLTVLCAICVVVLFGFMTLAHPERTGENLVNAVLTGVSAQTTTGFSSLPLQDLDSVSKLVLIVSMFIGGEVGSTAGGLKVLRLLLLFSLVRMLIQRTGIPASGRLPATLGGSPLHSSEINAAVSLLLVYLLVVLLSWMAFLAYGHAPLDALFEVVSALATAGLSTGVAAPGLEPGLKLLLCLVMLMGRVEVIAFVVLLYPRSWAGRRRT
jgi:trk system potassium uptake protein TrkH